jgi:mono/diheme cytochrome c family protein
MTSRFGWFVLGIIASIMVFSVGAYAFVWTGGVSMATASAPLPFEHAVARLALHASFRSALGLTNPTPFDETNLMAAARVYQQNCTVCHGAPGTTPTAIAKGMFPEPPQLFTPHDMITKDSDGEVYWKVTHGIRLSGMPGFESTLSDTERWQVTTLMRKADKLPATVQAAFAAMTAQSQQSAPLRLVQTLTMDKDVTGRFDHMAVDIQGGRLFLTAADHHTIEIFDLKSGKWMRRVTGLGKPAGIVYLSDSNRVLFSDGAGSANILDAASYKVVGSVKLADDADSLGFDRDANILYVVNGGKDVKETFSRISIVDTKNQKSLGDIKIDGERLEAMALETKGPRLFVNVTALNKVAVLDRKTRQVLTTWGLGDAKENVPMAFDEAGHRLFVATRQPGRLIVLNSDTGKEVASLPAAGGADDLAYDAARKRIYLSAGDGFVNVYQQNTPDTYAAMAQIPTGPGARNSRFVPEQNRLYVAVPAGKEGKPAEVQIYEVTR